MQLMAAVLLNDGPQPGRSAGRDRGCIPPAATQFETDSAWAGGEWFWDASSATGLTSMSDRRAFFKQTEQILILGYHRPDLHGADRGFKTEKPAYSDCSCSS